MQNNFLAQSAGLAGQKKMNLKMSGDCLCRQLPLPRLMLCSIEMKIEVSGQTWSYTTTNKTESVK